MVNSKSKAHCIFCELPPDRIIASGSSCVVIRDAYPVTPEHVLIISKRHVADYFRLTKTEMNDLHRMVRRQQSRIKREDPSVTGFNVGINSGLSAGQTIFHVHIHLIPRRDGDVVEPRGGVRGAILGRQQY